MQFAVSITATSNRGDSHDDGEAATIMTAALSCMTPGVTAGHEVLTGATCSGSCHARLAGKLLLESWEREKKKKMRERKKKNEMEKGRGRAMKEGC